MADATVDNEAPTAAALLDYAGAPPGCEAWGPVLFRPSRRSVVLLVLLGVAAGWLGVRHDPWRRVGTIPGDMAVGPPFTRDGLILTFDSRAGVNLYDPATARLVRNVLPAIDPNACRYHVMNGGERILALPYTERIASVYDVQSGRVVRRLPNPDRLGSQLLLVAPDGPRVVTVQTDRSVHRLPTTDVTYWDLTQTSPATRPVPIAPTGSDPQFSPDGRRIVQTSLTGGELTILDGHTMDVLFRDARDGEAPLASKFLGADRFWVLWVPRPAARTPATTRPVAERFEIRSVATGDTLAVIPVPTGLLPVYTGSFTVCDDGRTWGLLASSAPPAAGWTGLNLHVADAATGRVLLSRGGCTGDWPLVAFPNSRRFLAGDRATRRLGVFMPPHVQPLALLPGTGALASTGDAEISADGRTILVRENPGPPALPVPTSRLSVYRPAGWDCPESRLGALAFPQTWLTAGLVALLAVSLTGDARRARREFVRRPVSPWLIGGLLLITIPLSAHALLAALLGHWVRTPAPVMLLLAIVLATHARAWRGVAIVGFCGLIPLLAWYAHTLQRAGLASSIAYRPLDRFYDVPVRLPLAGVLALALLVLAGLYLQLRPRAGAA